MSKAKFKQKIRDNIPGLFLKGSTVESVRALTNAWQSSAQGQVVASLVRDRNECQDRFEAANRQLMTRAHANVQLKKELDTARARITELESRLRNCDEYTDVAALRDRIAELERERASRDGDKFVGPYCAHCGGQHLGIDCPVQYPLPTDLDSEANRLAYDAPQSDGDRVLPDGREAEELRAGIEELISSYEGEAWEDELQALLDNVDARDSLAYLESKDAPPPDGAPDRVWLYGDESGPVVNWVPWQIHASYVQDEDLHGVEYIRHDLHLREATRHHELLEDYRKAAEDWQETVDDLREENSRLTARLVSLGDAGSDDVSVAVDGAPRRVWCEPESDTGWTCEVGGWTHDKQFKHAVEYIRFDAYQTAIETARREALERAAERAVKWFEIDGYPEARNDDDINSGLRSAILEAK